MAPHSSTLAWKIPWTEKPGGLQSMGRQGSDTTERLHYHFSVFTFMHWRRKWQPTPGFLPGGSQRRRSLVGCRLWGRTELDTTEATWRQQQHTASLVAQTVKNLPATPETWIPSLGWEDPLEKGKATHSSILAWRIPWTEEPAGLQSMGLQPVRHY